VDLVDEQQGPLAVTPALAGGLEDAPQVGDAREHRRQRLEMQVGRFGQQTRDGGLAAAGRSPQDQRIELARRQHAAERAFGTEQMVLAQDLVQGFRPQALSEGCRSKRREKLGRHATP